MKRITAWVLSVALMLCMTACGGSSEPEPSSSATDPKEENSIETGGKSTNDSKEINFEEMVALENDQCAIKIVGIEPDNMWGYTLKVFLENKSADKTYMYSVESAAIDGVECDPLFASEVAAGKKANEEISFSTSALKENGVVDYTDIELSFRVYDSDDWLADDIAKETVNVYPYGEENVSHFVREPKSSDTVLVDNEYISIIVTGYENDSIWGYTANLFLVNKSGDNLMFSVDDASVNGYMADPFFATSVSAGKCSFSSISWSQSVLEDNGITEVEEIEMQFRVYNSDDWTADDVFNETITLNP